MSILGQLREMVKAHNKALTQQAQEFLEKWNRASSAIEKAELFATLIRNLPLMYELHSLLEEEVIQVLLSPEVQEYFKKKREDNE